MSGSEGNNKEKDTLQVHVFLPPELAPYKDVVEDIIKIMSNKEYQDFVMEHYNRLVKNFAERFKRPMLLSDLLGYISYLFLIGFKTLTKGNSDLQCRKCVKALLFAILDVATALGEEFYMDAMELVAPDNAGQTRGSGSTDHYRA